MDGTGISLLQNSIVVNSSSWIRDAAGNNAGLTLNNIGDSSGVLVITVTPYIYSIYVPKDGTYCTGQNLDFRVNFDEPVTVDLTGGIIMMAAIMSPVTGPARPGPALPPPAQCIPSMSPAARSIQPGFIAMVRIKFPFRDLLFQ